MHLDGFDLRATPLVMRKEALAQLLAGERGILRYSEHLEGDGNLILQHACRLSLEGVVSKLRDGPYRSGRGKSWVKSKCSQRQEFVVAGYVPSSTSRKAIGSLVLGYYEDGKLIHAGRVGTGYTAAMAEDLYQRLERIRSPSSPFAERLSADAARQVRYVKPQLVAEVEFRGWTGDQNLRHASFRGLREDKDAAEIVREATGSAPHRHRAARERMHGWLSADIPSPHHGRPRAGCGSPLFVPARKSRVRQLRMPPRRAGGPRRRPWSGRPARNCSRCADCGSWLQNWRQRLRPCRIAWGEIDPHAGPPLPGGHHSSSIVTTDQYGCACRRIHRCRAGRGLEGGTGTARSWSESSRPSSVSSRARTPSGSPGTVRAVSIGPVAQAATSGPSPPSPNAVASAPSPLPTGRLYPSARCSRRNVKSALVVAEALIKAGLARDCPRFSGGRYAAVEPAAAREPPFAGVLSARLVAGSR